MIKQKINAENINELKNWQLTKVVNDSAEDYNFHGRVVKSYKVLLTKME